MTTHQTLFTHPKLSVSVVRGTEGPSHDPYSYEETTIKVPGSKIVIHAGLAEFIKLNGETFPISVHKRERFGEAIDVLLRAKVGYSRVQLERIARKKRQARTRACPLGGLHDLQWGHGFPGEELLWCTKCKHILDRTFNSSAIE